MSKLDSRQDLESLRDRLCREWDPDRRRVYVCTGTGCKACGGEAVFAALTETVGSSKLADEVDVVRTGCHGFCERGTLVMLMPAGTLYTHVKPEDVDEILTETLEGGKVVTRLLYRLPGEGREPGEAIARAEDIPFYKHQMRVALGLNGRIDPTNIEDYVREEGYQALAAVLFDKTSEQVIEEITASGLRGRGGGGFPTGLKWKFCRQSPGEQKYIICNADEGDPGAFMDRSLLEANPHAVLEGMAIGAFAMGAQVGYIYIRAEYPLAIDRLRTAIGQMREAGLLGEKILGSDFSFELKIKEGAGAFVCGEETALIASIEGHRGQPRPRPPFPAAKGLFGKPTNINNVETWGNVPLILRRGADWFASLGTEKSKGTKIFSLVGKVNNTGLVEVPMGMALRTLVDEIGAGVKGSGKLKAVQSGGPSGGCLPVHLMDLPIEYESLAKAGAIMGSGGLVVMDESTCMVDLARYFLTFTQSESCGECTPCRLGTGRMLHILERICAGQGEPGDVEQLESLARSIKNSALCGLGQTAPNPVLTTLKYFREEYEEHIHDKHCRAAVCKGLVVAPCHHTCPAGVEAHRYVRAIGQGKFEDAYLVVRERMPLPSVCGLVCFHPCETRCRRGGLDEPIAIRMLKGAAVAYGAQAEQQIPASARPSTGKKVAVIGSGPAGLTAAYYLTKRGGHEVVIHEALEEPGGMLRYGIPRYRLSAEDLDRDIDIVRAAGVEIRCSSPVESISALRDEGYHAVFVAHGAHASYALGLDGADETDRVHDCVQFLRRVTGGEKIDVGRRVAVVGGGNSAIDAARTSMRLGADKVTMLYRRSREEMPADDAEITDALDEGMDLQTLTLPIAVKPVDGGIEVTCQRMKLGRIDSSGRRRPEPIEGSEYTEVYDAIIAAIGQHPETPTGFMVETDKRGRVAADRDTLSTSAKGVWAGGDAVTGPASVVEAIAHGRRGAEEIDRFLGGKGDIAEVLAPAEDLAALPPMPDEAGDRLRPQMPHRPADERKRTFEQVELGYSKEAAIEEASRCLRCDIVD